MKASLQRQLAADLANSCGLDVLSFKDHDCIVFSRGETLKMFSPTSRRLLMGSPGDRRITGEIIVAFPDAVTKLKPPSKRHALTDIIFAALIENFPGVRLQSFLADGTAAAVSLERVRVLLDALPDDRCGWKAKFGDDFFEWPLVSRFENVVGYLRDKVSFPDEKSFLDKYFEISITDGGLA